MCWRRGALSRAHFVALPILCNHPNIVICFYVESLEGELRCSFLFWPLYTLPQPWRACTAVGAFKCGAGGVHRLQQLAAACLMQLHVCTVPLPDTRTRHVSECL